MKIVSVCRVYPTQRPGGMPFVAQDRADSLAALGHEVHVLTTGWPNAEDEVIRVEEPSGVIVHHLPCKTQAYTEKFATELLKQCNALRPEIVHLDSFDDKRDWWSTLTGRPYLACTMHGLAIGQWQTEHNRWMAGERDEPIFRQYADEIYRQAKILATTFDRVLAISDWERLQLLSMYNVPLSRVSLLPNPIPSYFFTMPEEVSFQQALQTPKFLCAAVSGHAERNFKLAERAAAQVGVQLVIAKDTPRRNMPGLYDSCLGVVIPTYYSKGLDLTYAEAIARGRAVICTTAAPYLLASKSPGVEGHVTCVNMNGQRALAAALKDLVESPVNLPRGSNTYNNQISHTKRWLQLLQH